MNNKDSGSGGPDIPVYYHQNQDQSQGASPDLSSKLCSVRGCSNPLAPMATTKMCEVCRSRHRVYAMTKRARRKMEKAAVAESSEAGDAPNPVRWMPAMSPGPERPKPASGTPDEHQMETPNTLFPTTSIHWEHPVIDPRLFAPATSSSELAGALTLSPPSPPPPPRPPPVPVVDSPAAVDKYYRLRPASSGGTAQSEITFPPLSYISTSREESEIARALQPTHRQVTPPLPSSMDDSPSEGSADSSARRCSVKGCKKPIPDDYPFKMCSACRDRYRGYGTTKRAKWKAERAAFDKELAELRAKEDERRAREGLVPLAESLEELRAWELSVIDEKVPLPPAVSDVVQSSSTTLSMNNRAMLDPNSGAESYGQSNTPRIDTGRYSFSPYSQPNASSPASSTAPPPSSARMCTVSHCHKILPGFYRYKRCEQHRLQNRYHSKLKRGREKSERVGASGSGVDANTGVKEDQSVGSDSDEGGVEGGLCDDPRSRGRSITGENAEQGFEAPHQSVTSFVSASVPTVTAIDAEVAAKKRNSVCAAESCCNLLAVGVRWRMCDECKLTGRTRKREMKNKEDELYLERKKAEAQRNGTDTITAQAQYTDVSGHELENIMDVDADGEDDAEGLHAESPLGVEVTDTQSAELPVPSTSPPPPATATSIPPTIASTYTPPSLSAPPAPSIKWTPNLTQPSPSSIHAYRSKTVANVVDKFILQNPHLSGQAQVFTDLLLPRTSQENSATTPKLSYTTTIPTTPAFVYKPPAKKHKKVVDGEKASITVNPTPDGAGTLQVPAAQQEMASSQSQPQAPQPQISQPEIPPAEASQSKPAQSQPPIPSLPHLPYPYSHLQYPVPYYIPPYGMPPYGVYPPTAPTHGYQMNPAQHIPYPYPHPPYPYGPPSVFTPLPPGYAYPPPVGFIPSPHDQSQQQAHVKVAQPPINPSQAPVSDAASWRHYTPEMKEFKGRRKWNAYQPPVMNETGAHVIVGDGPSASGPMVSGANRGNDSVFASNLPEESATQRPCRTKACRRMIPANFSGPICERCRVRTKKQQAKAKLRYKLEPRKSLMLLAGRKNAE